MFLEQEKAFYHRLTTENFRTQVLEAIAADDELKTLTEEELKTIFGGYLYLAPIYGGPYPREFDDVGRYV